MINVSDAESSDTVDDDDTDYIANADGSSETKDYMSKYVSRFEESDANEVGNARGNVPQCVHENVERYRDTSEQQSRREQAGREGMEEKRKTNEEEYVNRIRGRERRR